MKLRIFLLAALIGCFSLAQATVHNVSVGSNFFMPNSLTINAGDTVLWTNTGGFHNVDGTDATNPVTFINGPASSASWTYQRQFNQTGTYNYVCTPHAPGMSGTITVNAVVLPASNDIIITGAFDGPLPGGNPKGVELYVVNSISDLSTFGLGSANNGGGTDGQEFTFPAVSAAAGSYIYVTTDTAQFRTFFGFGAGYQDGSMAINGDDAVELFSNGSVADVFGDINVDGTGQPWEYLDSWAYRNNGTGPDDSTFVLGSWSFGGINTYDPVTTNAAASAPMPIGTYSTTVVNPPASGIPTYTIAQATTIDAATGVADSIGVECKLVGLVSTPNFRSSGVEFTFTDMMNTAGIIVRNTSLSGYTVAMGDQLRVIGTIGQFRGLTQLNVDSIVVISSGNTLPAPNTQTTLSEVAEGRIIRLNGVQLVTTTNWGNGNNDIYFPNGGDTVTMRFDTDFGTAWGTAPTGTFDVIGVGGQFSFATNLDDGYQIFPRIASDIITSTTVPNFGGVNTYTIDTVTRVNASGVVDSLNVNCRLVGFVSTPSYRAAGSGVEFTFTNAGNTAGILVRNTTFNSYVPTMGDELRVMGTVNQFRGLAQFVPDSIVVVSTGNVLPTPTIETTLDENDESRIVRFNGMRTVTGGGTWGSGNVDVYSATTNDTITMRFDTDFGTAWGTAPTTAFDVIGVGGQFSFAANLDDGYQLFPRIASDIIPVVATTPTINFPAAAQNQLENAGTVTISLPIAPSATAAQTVKLYVTNGASVTAGDYTTTPAAVADTITLTAAANAATVSFDVTVTDDMLQEASENITFTIAKVGTALTIGAINTHVFTIDDNDTPIPTYDIAQITGVDPVTGAADSTGTYCKIIATVTSPQLHASRTDFFITNSVNTAGIKVSKSSLTAYSANIGDVIRVVGTIGQFRGGIQIDPDSIQLVSSGNPIQPVVFNQNLGEATEGRVLRLNGVELVDTTGWPSSNFGNFDIVLSTGDTVILRIDSDIPTVWGPAPLGKFDVIGVAGQFASSGNNPPYSADGYQILPRVNSEIIVKLPKLAITEIMSGSNLSSPIGGDWFELTNYGTTPINLNNFSWDDDSRTAGTHTIASLITQTIDAGESVIFYDGLATEAVAWSQEWSQQGNNIVIYAADEFGPMGFSGLSTGGDEVNFYDDKGQLVARATYGASLVTAGVSIEFDTTSSVIGLSTVGVRNAYTSANGDIGSPSNLNPISIAEFLVNNMEIYPNPATSIVKLTSTNNAKKLVKITDVAGSVVRTLNSTNTNLEINVSNLPKGVYLIQVTVDDASATHKLIVQ